MSENNKQGIDVALQRALELADSANNFDPIKNIDNPVEHLHSNKNDSMGKAALTNNMPMTLDSVAQPPKCEDHCSFVDYRKNLMEKKSVDPTKQSVEYALRVSELISAFRADESRGA